MIRPYRPGDHVAIAEIFPRAVHEIASGVYSEDQCAAWAAKDPDPKYWKERCARKQPYVFVVDDRVAGFCELDPDGHIDCTYVHPDHKRKGIASQLVFHAVIAAASKGLKKVNVEASICAKPLFERLGFHTIEEQEVQIRGIGLKNFKMERECK